MTSQHRRQRRRLQDRDRRTSSRFFLRHWPQKTVRQIRRLTGALQAAAARLFKFRLVRLAYRLVLVFAGLYLLAAIVLTLFGLANTAQPADVGVVFGNKVEPWGEPSPSLASRLDKAVALYHQGLYPYIIASGGLGKEGWDEAQVMADYMVSRGVPRSAILIDSQGNNTYLTALHTAEFARQHGFKRFVLVSHFYHLPRARLTFERLGLSPAYIAHADRFVARDFYFGLLREVIAFPVYFVRYPAQAAFQE